MHSMDTIRFATRSAGTVRGSKHSRDNNGHNTSNTHHKWGKRQATARSWPWNVRLVLTGAGIRSDDDDALVGALLHRRHRHARLGQGAHQ